MNKLKPSAINSKLSSFLTALLILLITFLIYIPSLKSGFLNWDDPSHILENKLVRSLSFENIQAIFASRIQRNLIPLTILSWAVEYHFFQFNAFIFHLNNLILHLGVTLLVYGLARQFKLNILASGCAALLFGIHPMHVESVVWLTERKDVLYGFFYMASLLSYVKYVQSKHLRWFMLSVPLGLLSMLAKPMAMTLPAVFLLVDWYFGRKDLLRISIEKGIHTLYILPLLMASLVSYHLPVSVLSIIWTAVFYPFKFFVPIYLSPMYHLPKPVSLGNWPFLISVIVFIGAGVYCWMNRQKRLFIFSVLFYGLTIFPMLNFGDALFINFIADRYMYIPSIGFCLFLGFGCDWMMRKADLNKDKKKMFLTIGCAVVLMVSLMFKTWNQSKIWKDDISFYSTIIRHAPEEISAYLNRGKAYADQERFELALQDYTQALQINPNHLFALNNRGSIYRDYNQMDSAMKDFNQLLTVSPGYWEGYNNRGKLFERMGKYDLALKDFNQSVLINPEEAGTYLIRGNIYFKINQLDQALSDYLKAVECDPYFADAYNNSGNAHFMKKEFDQAIQFYSKALSINPSYKQSYFNRGLSFKERGDYQSALNDFDAALNITPEDEVIDDQKSLIFLLQGKAKKGKAKTF